MSGSRSRSESSDEQTGPYTSGSDSGSGSLPQTPSIAASSSSAVPQLQPVNDSRDSGPLDTLRKRLKKCRKIAINLQSDLTSAYKITDAGFFTNLFSSAPNPEHKALLTPLLRQIDPHKKLDSQLASLINAEKALTAFLTDLMESVYRKKQDDLAFVKHQVDEAYEALFKSFDAEFNQLREKQASHQQALSRYCGEAAEAKKQFDWVQKDAEEVLRLLDKAATVNAAFEKKIREETFVFPSKLRDVRPCLEEGRLDFSDAIKKSEAVAQEVRGLGAVHFDELQQQVEATQKRLGELKKGYDAASDAYLQLPDVHSTEALQKERQLLSRGVNDLLNNGERAFVENADSIIRVIKTFIDDPNNNKAAAKTEIDRLFTSRGSVVEGFKPQLVALLARVNRLEVKIKAFEGEISRLDEEYKNFNLEPQLQKILADDREKDKRARIKALSRAFATEEIEAIKKELEGIQSAVENCQSSVSTLGSKLAAVREAAKSDVTSTLSLIAPTVPLEESEAFFKRILQGLSQQIESVVQNLGAFEKEEREVSSVLTRIRALQAAWKRHQNLDPVVARQAYLAEQLKELDNGKEATRELKEAKERWDDCANQKDKFNRWFSKIRTPAVFRLKEAVFNTIIMQTGEALTQLAMAQPGVSAEADLELYHRICGNYQALFSALGAVKSFFQVLVPEFGQAKKVPSHFAVFDTVNERINKVLDITQKCFSEVESYSRQFKEYYSKIKWDGSAAVSPEELAEMKSFPAQLEGDLQNIRANAHLLMDEKTQESMQALLAANLEKFRKQLANLREHLAALTALQQNLNTYLERYDRYKLNTHLSEQASAKLTTHAAEVRERDEAVKRIIRLNARCRVISNELQDKHGKINTCRADYSKLLRNELNIADAQEHLQKLLDNIDQEETNKTNVTLLFEKIARVKRIEGALQCERAAIAAMSAQPDGLTQCNAELFWRLRREFLFSGKSRALIEALKAHSQLPRHRQSQKGLLIARFFTQLFDENHTTDLRQLLNCLEQPFGANNPENDALFQYTGIYKLGSHEKDSTTKQLIAGLRRELLALVQRENVGPVGSIGHALQLDCAQAKREYHAILDSKQLVGESDSMRLADTCEARLFAWLAAPPLDATAKKIQQDLIGIQRWAGANGVNMQMRERRMRCAVEIRKNLDNEQNGNVLTQLYAEDKFTYTYQYLRCYMERVVTKREREVAIFWQNLDRIAFSSDNEATKYTKMRESVLSYYRGLRQMKNGSAGYFFGRGSRLGDALEHFLTRPESVDGGFGYVHGNLPDQVRHHHPETGCFDGVAKKISETLFCYARN